MPPLSKDTIVAVIGAGAMGAGIAQVAASYGHQVKLFDKAEGAASRAIDSIGAGLGKLVSRGKLDHSEAEAILSRLQPIEELSQLADAGLVVEAIIENLDIKRSLFAELEQLCAADTLLTSNTSSLSITSIAAGMQHPERFAGLHFFNPAPIMKLVEVISGLDTDRHVAETLYASASAWGKKPVHARSTPGFIVNRLARPFYAEGLRLLEEGAADTATIDALLRDAGGFRMGPFELMDLIGHDVNYAVTCSVFDAYYGDQRFLPSLTQKALVDGGRLGRKSGRGFYDYRTDAVQPQPQSLSSAGSTLVELPTLIVEGDLGVAEPLLTRLQQTGIHVVRRQGLANQQGRLLLGDAVLALTDGRMASERAVAEATANLVLFDLALDYQQASRLAVAIADQADRRVLQPVTELFALAGIQLSLLDDAPGLAVMRTVAMLANEAADAVMQQVCSAADADIAMQFGVNYPRGPLAWAEAVGTQRIHQVLTHMQQAYGEDRYRPSRQLKRMAVTGGHFHVNAA
ncbi:3-hydroxyacyl-CoA dehydrogenase [Pokkaliibacter plantistimulans]|uniref:3-hydroxyacyl-CoA dehydrogenase n=1 Tax=Pokkaliibacter plantistimulans TaxID=1635171 RepID=A0ABX5LXK6_9GAMM|nr:3-hydroxyacyl-CoA dehydrogenase PaaH [Pokkaliibacter plantistimulans]PXF31399.1 3-hydroxyacyl-CoA dehydrogenase [Pokkaliibacter plantistimulans]